ncbi:MAG: GGDEF domain-containing protein [Rhodopirellula sp.]|nr:GGDEF domain-containing protein [Rhodopirellula sp.]
MADSTSLLDKILKSPQLPSVPAVAIRLLDLAQDLDSSTGDIVETIKSDPALAAKILRSANSSYFNFRSEIRTLEQAVPLIGRTVITSLALSFSLSSEAMADGVFGQIYKQFWLRSVVQASAAETLASYIEKKSQSGELFMAGLLLDIGQLAMLRTLRNDYLPVIEKLQNDDTNLQLCEQAVLGFDHAVVGSRLMNLWKFPEPMCEAALQHHGQPADLTNEDSRELAHAMMVVSSVGDYFCSGSPGVALAHLRELTATLFEMSEVTLTEFLDATDARVQTTAELLSADTDELLSAADLMSQACEQLAAISIAQSQESLAQQRQSESERVELETQNQQLREQAFCDPLTTLYNRRYFDEAMQKEIDRSCRRGTPIGVLFVDVDRFKQLNDTYGHQFGDTVLARLGITILSNIRKSDVAARYGGEEFVVLAVNTSEAGLRVLAERIRQAVENDVFELDGSTISVTASVGATFASLCRGDRNMSSRILESADAAMYESKRRGRNCVTMNSMATELERRIAQLIVENRFSCWLVDREIVDGAEMFEAVQASRPAEVRLGELAYSRGWLAQADVQRILDIQESTGERFGAIGRRLDLLTERQLALLLAEQSECSDILKGQLVDSGLLNLEEVEVLFSQFVDERDQRLNAPLNASASTATSPTAGNA